MGYSTPFLIAGSMATSTILILLNKHLMQNYHFNFPVALSTFHFLCTYTVLELLCRFNFFSRAENYPSNWRIIAALESVAGIVFMNLSLKMNSVGFYQLSKLLCIPAMVIANYFWYNKKTPWRTCGSLVFLLIGVALFSISEVSFNFKGAVIAAIAIFFNVIFQCQTTHIAQTYHISGPSYQLANSGYMAFFGLLATFPLECQYPNSILEYEFEFVELFIAFMTGMVAVWSNVFGISLIGKASAVTFQVTGHAKTILIFIFGLIYLDKDYRETKSQKIKKILGLALGMIGTILYSIFEMSDKKKAQQEADRKRLEEEERNKNFVNEPAVVEENEKEAEFKSVDTK